MGAGEDASLDPLDADWKNGREDGKERMNALADRFSAQCTDHGLQESRSSDFPTLID